MRRAKPNPVNKLPVEEAAVTLGCSPSTVWRLARAGRLTTVRLLGRTVFDATEVEALKAEREGEKCKLRQ